MINELHGLAATLEEVGIETREWHREYETLPKVTDKAPCIRIWLDGDGRVCDYGRIDAGLARLLRKFGNYQQSFPGFNISPLYRLTDEDRISEWAEWREGGAKPDMSKIRSWCVADNWKSSLVKKVNRSLHDVPRELLGRIHASGQAEGSIVAALARLAEQVPDSGAGSFRASLEDCVFRKLEQGEEVALSLLLLFHNGDPQKSPEKDVGISLSVFLDMEDWQKYEYPMASEHTTAWLNDRLTEADQIDRESWVIDAVDAFGTPFANPNQPMPKADLSGFKVALRSMFDGQPCQYRYGRINDGSYPIAAENRSRLKKSLEWLAYVKREGVTWRKADKDEIVFVYPSKLPEVPLRFASLFGPSPGKENQQAQSRFTEEAAAFCKALKGIPPGQKPDRMQVFAIRKIDKARSKVIFTHNTTPEKLAAAAMDWQSGCGNLPRMGTGAPSVPFPLQAAGIVNNVWKQNGELAQGKAAVKRMKYYQGMELLLDILRPDMLHGFLHILLTNASGLVSYVGDCVHAGECKREKNNEKKLAVPRGKAADVFAVIGLLLYKCGIRKETYMENTMYLVGQLLHISDELHAMYCKVVRKGDIPLQLAGSSLLVTASETPCQAIGQLVARMAPYIQWANQYRHKDVQEKGKESWRAGWYKALYRNTMDKLAPILTDATRTTDFEKAQLFIGYLASLPKREHSESKPAAEEKLQEETKNGQ